MNLRDVVAACAVIPELLVRDVVHSVAAVQALRTGGLRAIEINMRSVEAGACIEAVRKGVPDAIVGAGSLTRAVEFAVADRAGAQFGSTPGLTPDLAAASRGARFPLMPGVMTPTEVLAARNAGFTVQKFYAADPAGSAAMLGSWHAIFPEVAFVPSGALTPDLAADYLAQPNVLCVAGSWATLQSLIASADWRRVEEWARQAAQFKLKGA